MIESYFLSLVLNCQTLANVLGVNIHLVYQNTGTICSDGEGTKHNYTTELESHHNPYAQYFPESIDGGLAREMDCEPWDKGCRRRGSDRRDLNITNLNWIAFLN